MAPKKRGRIVGIGSVNDVPRARAAHHARVEEESTLRRDLSVANQVIERHNEQFKAMANLFDMMMETSNVNPAVATT